MLVILLIIVNFLYWWRNGSFVPFILVNHIISIHCVNKSFILLKNFCLIFFNIFIQFILINWSRNFHIFINFFFSSFFLFFLKFLLFKRMLSLLFKSLWFLLFFFLFLSLLLLLLFLYFFLNFLLNVLWISLLEHRFSHF